jgi:hypothetical protein
MVRRYFALALLLFSAQWASAAYEVGQTPSNFTLSDWDGGSWSLYAQRGKVVFLNFGAVW